MTFGFRKSLKSRLLACSNAAAKTVSFFAGPHLLIGTVIWWTKHII